MFELILIFVVVTTIVVTMMWSASRVASRVMTVGGIVAESENLSSPMAEMPVRKLLRAKMTGRRRVRFQTRSGGERSARVIRIYGGKMVKLRRHPLGPVFYGMLA